jgi:hypothetical protein
MPRRLPESMREPWLKEPTLSFRFDCGAELS